jgi:hypothetical protein
MPARRSSLSILVFSVIQRTTRSLNLLGFGDREFSSLLTLGICIHLTL